MIKNDSNIDLSFITEKLQFSGASSLNDEQLLTVILGRGAPKESHLNRAKQLLARYSTLEAVVEAPLSEIGGSSLLTLKCCAELGRRLRSKEREVIQIENSEEAHRVVRELLRGATGEEFWIICLNRSLKVIDKQCMFRGGISSSVVDIKMVVRYILNNLSSAVIVAHNHPSGSITPSSEDLAITKQIVEALKLFDIICFDHLIVGENELFSFRAEGLIV